MMRTKKMQKALLIALLCGLVVVFLTPIFFVLMNSFKGKLYISDNPFAWPTGDMYVGLENYI